MKLSLSILLILFSLEAFASSQLKLQIMFKKGTSARIKDELHKKLGPKLDFRGKNLQVDLVTFNKHVKIAEAPNICKEYLKSSHVAFCEEAIKLKNPPTICDELNDISGVVNAPLSRENCDVMPASTLSAPYGLHPLWSQMRIGSDLVRADVSARTAAGESFPSVNVGNIDSGFEQGQSDARGDAAEFSAQTNGSSPAKRDHGTKVLNLIAGEGNHGASANARISFVRNAYDTPGSFIQNMDDALSEKPEVLNLEIHTLCVIKGFTDCSENWFGGGNIVRESIREAAEEMIVVAAAGNYYPNGSPAPQVSDENVIVVGSSDPYGLVSGFSDESPDVTILAPSDYHQRVPGVVGDGFGGTSGATPLVTAAVADVKSVLRDLKGNEASKILKLSSTKLHFTNALPQHNGAGQLNSYRAFKLAEKLKAAGWPENREELLTIAESWDFKTESTQELNRAKELLASSDCDSYKAAFTHLRKAFLLDETNEETRSLLTVIYQAQNYPAEAQYLKNFDVNNLSNFIASSGAIDYTCGIPGCFTPPSTPAVMVNGTAISRAQTVLSGILPAPVTSTTPTTAASSPSP